MLRESGVLKMTESARPRFGSWEFHTRFLPALLAGRLRGQQARSGFNSVLEMYLAVAVCLVLLAVGVPAVLSHRSVLGWILVGVGGVGFLALTVHSLASRGGARPSLEGFLEGVFFFFPVLGLSAGVLTGTLNHSLLAGLAVGVGGLVTGYLLGILAGLGLQYLGWMAGIVNGLALLAVLGMLFTDLILLSIALFA